MFPPFVVRVSGPRYFSLLALCLGLVVLCLWIAGVFGPVDLRGSPTSRFFVGWAGALFAGWAIVVGLRRMISGGDRITVDDRGIRAREWSDQFIPWKDIRAISRQRLYSSALVYQTFLCLELEDAGKYPSSNWLRRTGLDKAMGYGDVSFSTIGMDKSIDELADAIDQRWRHYRQSNPAPSWQQHP